MASTILGNLWQSSLYLETETSSVHQKFMKGLGDYITTNVTLNVTFTGTLISYPFTPITTTDVVKINGSPTTAHKVAFAIPSKDKDGMYTDGLAEWLDWMKSVYSGIAKALIIGPLTVPTTPIVAFQLMTAPTWSRDVLLSAHQSNWDDPQGSVLDALANSIMSDMRKFFTIRYPAIYSSAYTGVATINSVTTP